MSPQKQQADRRHPVPLFHPTDWTVVVDPPGQLRHLYRTSTKALADVYLRGLKANAPHIAAHSYILKPARNIADMPKIR